jgi:hypothetical protein
MKSAGDDPYHRPVANRQHEKLILALGVGQE